MIVAMLKELVKKQQNYTNHFFDTFNLTQLQQIIDLLLNSAGMIFFTGVGKSGMIAKKIAVTMASTGTKALFLSPVDALHGDIGMVSAADSFILLSKSGESEELLQLAPAIRKKGAQIIGFLCSNQSRLKKLCDYTLQLPFQSELCPFDLAPTMSTTYQLLVGDLMTVALMKHKQFTLDDYALNHPAGRIGRRIVTRVQDLMLKEERIPFCHSEQLLTDLLYELTDKRCGCLLVVDEEKKIKGIFTDGDLRRALQKHRAEIFTRSIGELMTKAVQTTSPQMLAIEALKMMEANPIQRLSVLPVIDEEQKVVGLLHIHDLVQSGI